MILSPRDLGTWPRLAGGQPGGTQAQTRRERWEGWLATAACCQDGGDNKHLESCKRWRVHSRDLTEWGRGEASGFFHSSTKVESWASSWAMEGSYWAGSKDLLLVILAHGVGGLLKGLDG
jgi:hypothetical protein